MSIKSFTFPGETLKPSFTLFCGLGGRDSVRVSRFTENRLYTSNKALRGKIKQFVVLL